MVPFCFSTHVPFGGIFAGIELQAPEYLYVNRHNLQVWSFGCWEFWSFHLVRKGIHVCRCITLRNSYYGEHVQVGALAWACKLSCTSSLGHCHLVYYVSCLAAIRSCINPLLPTWSALVFTWTPPAPSCWLHLDYVSACSFCSFALLLPTLAWLLTTLMPAVWT